MSKFLATAPKPSSTYQQHRMLAYCKAIGDELSQLLIDVVLEQMHPSRRLNNESQMPAPDVGRLDQALERAKRSKVTSSRMDCYIAGSARGQKGIV